MEDLILEVTEMKDPVLKDEHGKQIEKFNSASIGLRKSGNKSLDTDPQFLRADFPIQYSRPHAGPLYLTDGQQTHTVIVVGGLLKLA
jgi:hypothetical protein